jgi:hypothetical protein
MLAACAVEKHESPKPYANWADPLQLLPQGSKQTARVCAREGDDLVRDAFCGATPPALTGLVELQTALGLDSSHISGLSGLSVTANSTALASRSVSAINPRVIAVRVDAAPVEMLATGFARGEQVVELVVRDRGDHALRFYLVGFAQACNAHEQGCTPGDLLTPAVEHDWTEVTLYDEEDLADTVLDCRQCHQPEGPGTPKLLRMQEFESPWTHWFSRSSEGGRALLDDYLAAKGDESIAGMTSQQIDRSLPENLQILVRLDHREQPNEFDSEAIEREVKESAAKLGGMQPSNNSVLGQSTTWRTAYERAQRGLAIPVPYLDVKVTDPEKLERMTSAYQAYRRGELEQNELPDLRDVFPNDPRRLAALGFTTEPGLDGGAVLVQACSQCHNPRLDQSLSRALPA